jgi:cell division protein FtsZ
MPIQFDLPKEKNSIIKVIGVGGGGCNAVNHMFRQGIVGVNFAVCNTDAQAILQSPVPIQIQLGPGLTEGRGAGSQPEIGKNATIESLDEIKKALGGGTKMIFITAGMGGGTGTGGAPVVAKAARELGILTVGIVTSPFMFEGHKRIAQAKQGIEEMKDNVDTLIIISNDKVREMHGNLKISEAFAKADDVLTIAAKGIAEIITVPGYVNVDFEDVNTVMKNSGVAIMGMGIADGEDRAMKAVKSALASPLLNDNDIHGARHVLLNISSGNKEVTMDEVGDIITYVQEAAGYTSEIIWGNCTDDALAEKIAVTLIATGFEGHEGKEIDLTKKKDNRPIAHKNERPAFGGYEEKPKYNAPPAKEETILPKKNERIVFNLEDDDEKIGGKHIIERDRPTTFSRSSEQKNKPMFDEDDDEQMRLFIERRKRLRGLNMKLQNPAELGELETEPAYKRRNIDLEDLPHSSESNVSKYSLYEDENARTELKRRNPFLHDNVD